MPAKPGPKTYPTLSIVNYSPKEIKEVEAASLRDCIDFAGKKKTVTWANVNGLGDKELLSGLAEAYGLHPLVQEDILHPRQRPKMEDYDDYIYIVLRMLSFNEKTHSIDSEQVSIILGSNYVISIQEKKGKLFHRVREWLRRDKGKLRRMGPDFLAYSLLDVVVDNYYTILERLGEKIASMEEAVMREPSPRMLQKIRMLKKEMLGLRKAVWPLRELLLGLERESTSKDALVSKTTAIYLRDVYDHTIQVIDTTETYRDTVSSMVDIYLSSLSNRMNEVMKVLTIIGTIFIPLTFITGLYGMNFKYMPELEHPLGYPAVLLLMALLGILMLYYFRKKDWI
ncbi:magnesium/cobalt transporter CorA [Candidatus Micrarchaeota archaeon]|nr:magnesium/cobalt transporter CorA [Candidatus Micrarchaeota archaeon]